MVESNGGQETDPLLGQTVAEWEILEKLGEGGFGSVYKAWDTKLKRDVALKVMATKHTSSLEYIQRFIREAIGAAQLNHPNIIQVHRVGRDEERNLHFIVMEFLEGEPLSRILRREGAIPHERAFALMLQCVNALAYAQGKDLVHRDLKPGNILVDKQGGVKIADWGLTGALAAGEGILIGTPYFMSSELFQGKPVDGRTDIFSLGVTFYYSLSGVRPYDGTTPKEVLEQVLAGNPTPVKAHAPEVPDGISAIIQRMIARDPEDRYQRFLDVQRDMMAYLGEIGEGTTACRTCGAPMGGGESRCGRCGATLEPVAEPSRTSTAPTVRELMSHSESGRFAIAANLLDSLLKGAPLHDDLKSVLKGLVQSMQERLTQLHLDQARAALDEGHLRVAQEAFEDVVRVAPESGDLGKKVAELSRLLDDLNIRISAEEDKLLGRKLGKWVLKDVLGEGRFGKVYTGYESRLRRTVAVKVLRREFYTDPRCTDRFLKEAQIVAGLRHENIVGLHDVGWDKELLVHYLVMEYVRGGSLQSIVKEAREVPVAAAVGVVLQCARALRAAHARGVVHRDIKPGNIMITPEGRARITDFGLARSPDHARTTTGVAGTPHYMSLEQWQGLEDHRTDIYALGVTLFVLLGRSTPYEGDTPPQLLFRLSREEPRDLATIRDDIPDSLLDVVNGMMAKEVGDRYQSMGEVAAALEASARAGGVDLDEGQRWVTGRTGTDPSSGEPETRTQ